MESYKPISNPILALRTSNQTFGVAYNTGILQCTIYKENLHTQLERKDIQFSAVETALTTCCRIGRK